jgi:hypothetical protein
MRKYFQYPAILANFCKNIDESTTIMLGKNIKVVKNSCEIKSFMSLKKTQSEPFV